MKNVVVLLFLAAGLGLAAFVGYSTWQHEAHDELTGGELEWLRQEFNLDDEQFQRIEEIHAEYRPICEAFCDRVIEAKKNLEETLVNASSYSKEVEEQLVELSRVKEECNRSMLQHIYEVAAVMNPEQRIRYLKKARTQVTGRAHGDR